MKQTWFKLHNIVFGLGLSPMQLMVYTAICAHANRFGAVIIKYNTLALCCGCSVRSVTAAVTALCNMGLIHKAHRYNKDGHYIANVYHLAKLSGAWTKLDRSIFAHKVGKSAFAVFLFLSRCACNCNAFPSCTKIAKATGLSLPSVRKAVKLLVGRKLLQKLHQRRKCGCYGCNRYILEQKKRIYAPIKTAYIQRKTDCKQQSTCMVNYLTRKVKFFYIGVGKFLHNRNKLHLRTYQRKRKYSYSWSIAVSRRCKAMLRTRWHGWERCVKRLHYIQMQIPRRKRKW